MLTLFLQVISGASTSQAQVIFSVAAEKKGAPTK